MKAVAVFPGRREIKLVDHQEPRIESPGQVKLRILETGICGTDKEISRFEYGTPPEHSEYLIIGHEAFAEVVETGSQASDLKEGDLVVPMVRRPCSDSTCVACREGSQDFCQSGEFSERGIKEAHGFMTEFVVEETQYLQRVPRELRDLGVLVEPLTIAEKALRQVWNVQERLPWNRAGVGARGGRALVLGAGPVGLLGAMVLVRAGFETYVYSREPQGGAKARIVESANGRYVSAQDVSVDDLPTAVGKIDLVYEACGASQLAFRTLDLLAPNAIFIFTGVPGRKAPIEVNADRIMRNLVLRNQVIFGTVNAGDFAFEAAVRDLAAFAEDWPEATRSMVSGRYPVESHLDLLDGTIQGIKNVVSFATV